MRTSVFRFVDPFPCLVPRSSVVKPGERVVAALFVLYGVANFAFAAYYYNARGENVEVRRASQFFFLLRPKYVPEIYRSIWIPCTTSKCIIRII